MKKTLILMRHAKSDWSVESLQDFDRTLNERGQVSAKGLGAWLAREGYIPGEVITSGAVRTEETWAGVKPALPAPLIERSERAMYEAGAATLLRVLKSATEDVVLMIAHNPGIAMFASQLVNVAPDHPRFRDYPTGATTVIQFEKDSWLNVLKGDVAAFVTPRELVG